MTSKTFLIRLMAYTSLTSRTRVQPEDAMCVQFASNLRVATVQGRLKGVWLHPAQELCYGHATGLRAAISRAMGMHVGVADYLFLWDGGSAALEAKIGKGRLTPAQTDFQTWCTTQGVRHREFRSIEEGLQALRDWGLLS